MAILLGLGFCVVAPLIAPIALLYFLICTLIGKYQMVYVFSESFQSGGRVCAWLPPLTLSSLPRRCARKQASTRHSMNSSAQHAHPCTTLFPTLCKCNMAVVHMCAHSVTACLKCLDACQQSPHHRNQLLGRSVQHCCGLPTCIALFSWLCNLKCDLHLHHTLCVNQSVPGLK